MRVDEVIERISARYREAAQYEDRGTAFILHNPALQANYETRFVRPDAFVFTLDTHEVRGEEQLETKYAIAYDRGSLSFEPHVPDLGIDSLDHALAALTGVSVGVAHFIPQLLMPDMVTGRHLFEWGGEHALGTDATVDGATCHSVEMRDGNGVHRVYASNDSFVIRRIEFLSAEDAAQEHQPAAGHFVWRINYRHALLR